MPIYDYHCNNCQNNFEIIHLNFNDFIYNCPKCKSQDFFKKISSNISFYIPNDYELGKRANFEGYREGSKEPIGIHSTLNERKKRLPGSLP